MGPGSEFNADFSNNSPLVVANFSGDVNATTAARFFSGPKVNAKGINFTYERPYIDGPLLGEIRLVF